MKFEVLSNSRMGCKVKLLHKTFFNNKNSRNILNLTSTFRLAKSCGSDASWTFLVNVALICPVCYKSWVTEDIVFYKGWEWKSTLRKGHKMCVVRPTRIHFSRRACIIHMVNWHYVRLLLLTIAHYYCLLLFPTCSGCYFPSVMWFFSCTWSGGIYFHQESIVVVAHFTSCA